VAQYFLDTSALVKRYAIFVSQLAIVEVGAALSRMAREHPPRLSVADRTLLTARFRRHFRAGYTVVPVTSALLTRAADLCALHPLRAYDAVQLASALGVRDRTVAAGLPPPTFVCADVALLAVAASAGMPTEDPNAHP